MQVTVLTASEPAVLFYQSLGFSVDEATTSELTPSLRAEAYVISAPVLALK